MTGDELPRCRSVRMCRVNEADSTAHALRLLLGVTDEDRGIATSYGAAMALAGRPRSLDLPLSVRFLGEERESMIWGPPAKSSTSS